MNILLTNSEKDAILFHLVFGITSVLVLASSPSLEPRIRVGFQIWALVIGYHGSIVWVALRRLHGDWLRILRILVPVSVLMVLPDGYLATGLKTIAFEDMRVGQIFKVTSFMSFMWTIPLFVSTMVGRGLESRGFCVFKATIGAGLSALAIFVVSEELLPRIPIWYALENCRKVGNVAIYVLFPEFSLGAVVYLWCRYRLSLSYTSQITVSAQIFGAYMIMSMYLGNLVVCFMVIDGHENIF